MNKEIIQHTEHIRTAIQREFLDRCKKNPAYSLRAFAKYLEIDQSFLTRILKGQRSITTSFAHSVGSKLGLKPAQVKSLFNAGTAAMPGFLPLADDEFEIISDWRHFAVLELVKTKGFVLDYQAMAKRLDIHVEEVRDVLERLQRLNFTQIKNKKVKLLSPNTTWTNSQTTTDARKQFQRSLIAKSLEAIDHVPFEDRENGSVTLAINSKRLPEFKEKLKAIQRELADFIQLEGEKGLNEVYQLTFAFFPLTKSRNK